VGASEEEGKGRLEKGERREKTKNILTTKKKKNGKSRGSETSLRCPQDRIPIKEVERSPPLESKHGRSEGLVEKRKRNL